MAAALIAGVKRLASAVPEAAAAEGENKAKLFPGVTGVVVKLLKACWYCVAWRCFLPE